MYVIGSMGSGKSTFLNYMLNCGKKEIFPTGVTSGSVTKEVQIETKYLHWSQLLFSISWLLRPFQHISAFKKVNSTFNKQGANVDNRTQQS